MAWHLKWGVQTSINYLKSKPAWLLLTERITLKINSFLLLLFFPIWVNKNKETAHKLQWQIATGNAGFSMLRGETAHLLDVFRGGSLRILQQGFDKIFQFIFHQWWNLNPWASPMHLLSILEPNFICNKEFLHCSCDIMYTRKNLGMIFSWEWPNPGYYCCDPWNISTFTLLPGNVWVCRSSFSSWQLSS